MSPQRLGGYQSLPGTLLQSWNGVANQIDAAIVRGESVGMVVCEFRKTAGEVVTVLHVVGDPQNQRIALETARDVIGAKLLAVR